jgi:nucleoid DNA-binding protein
MNQLFSHIEFLLHDYNCVIIPGFGGFVLNTISPQKNGIAEFQAPACELAFNRDLTHNDGLLAQSYMKNSSMTFESVMQKIEQDVHSLKQQLRERRHVDMGKLGSFDMHGDRRFVYTPGTFVRPVLFGLTSVALKPLIQMTPSVPARQVADRRQWRRNAVTAVAGMVAVALLMFILPVSDSAVSRQSAGIGWMQPKAPQQWKAEEPAIAVPDAEIIAEIIDVPAADAVVVEAAAEEEIQEELPRYYIIMGVFRLTESAQRITRLLHNEGFDQTGWMHRAGRIDVYAASFPDKAEADAYLKKIHKKFPAHADAWILKK